MEYSKKLGMKVDEARVERAGKAMNEFNRLRKQAPRSTTTSSSTSSHKKRSLSYTSSLEDKGELNDVSPSHMAFISLMFGDPYIDTEAVRPSQSASDFSTEEVRMPQREQERI